MDIKGPHLLLTPLCLTDLLVLMGGAPSGHQHIQLGTHCVATRANTYFLAVLGAWQERAAVPTILSHLVIFYSVRRGRKALKSKGIAKQRHCLGFSKRRI